MEENKNGLFDDDILDSELEEETKKTSKDYRSEEEIVQASKKTTAVLVSIIVVLMAVIVVFGYIGIKKIFFSNDTATNATATDAQNTTTDNETTVSTDTDTTTDTSTTTDSSDLNPPKDRSEFDITVKLGTYTGLEVQYECEEVSEQDIQDEIDYLLEDSAEEIEITDRPVQLGDIVNIDYIGMLDGVEFEGGADTDYDLEIGSGVFIDGFEDGLIGANSGDVVELHVTFPEDYGSEELAGQPAVFNVTINAIYAYETPEFTDEFVAANTSYSTVEEYKASIREELELTAQETADSNLHYALLDILIENTAFEGQIEDYIQDNVRYLKEYYDAQAMSYYGVDGATLFSLFYGWTAEEYEQTLYDETAYEIKAELIYSEIATVENFTISEEEYMEEVKATFLEPYGIADMEELLTQISQEELDKVINTNVLSRKAMNYVKDNAVIIY